MSIYIFKNYNHNWIKVGFCKQTNICKRLCYGEHPFEKNYKPEELEFESFKDYDLLFCFSGLLQSNEKYIHKTFREQICREDIHGEFYRNENLDLIVRTINELFEKKNFLKKFTDEDIREAYEFSQEFIRPRFLVVS